MQQTYMSAHGAGASQTTVQVDGLMVNGIDVDGAVQSYFNSSMSQEMVYTTSGASADVAGGGVRLNMIPRDGGNTLSGSLFLGYQHENFQSDNITQDLIDRGLKTSDGIGKLYEHRGRARRADQEGQDVVLRVGAQFPARHAAGEHLLRHSRHGHANLGAAAEQRAGRRSAEHQVVSGAHHVADEPEEQADGLQRSPAEEPRRGMTAGIDPATAGIVWNSPIYTTGSVKFSSTAEQQDLRRGAASRPTTSATTRSTSPACQRRRSRRSGTR